MDFIHRAQPPQRFSAVCRVKSMVTVPLGIANVDISMWLGHKDFLSQLLKFVRQRVALCLENASLALNGAQLSPHALKLAPHPVTLRRKAIALG